MPRRHGDGSMGNDGNSTAALLDSVFELLSKRRRRRLLYYLMSKDGAVSFDELEERVLRGDAGGFDDGLASRADDSDAPTTRSAETRRRRSGRIRQP